MYDHSDSSEKKAPQMRPLFAPKPEVPRGRNLIGDNPFYNYLGKPPAGTPLTTPKAQPWYSTPSTVTPNTLPIYGGTSQYYRSAADKLLNAPNFNLQALNPLDAEQNKAAQNRIKDFIGKYNLKILTNPNEAYQNKQYLAETFDSLLNDPRLERFYDILRLEKQNAKLEQDEFDKLKAEEAELTKKYNDYGAFKEELHNDLTNLMKQESDTNLLLEPDLKNFPGTAKYLQTSGLSSAEYDKIFNTRREGFWDRFFGSGDQEADEIEKIYKGLRLFSKKPQNFGKFLEGIDKPYVDWIRKHYTGGTNFDADIKYAINQLHEALLEQNRGMPDEKKTEREIEKWKDEVVKNIFKANTMSEAAEDFADKLTEFLQTNKKLPKTLGAQPKEIDLNNFILGSKELNNYLYQFLKNNPYGSWKEKLKQDLQTTFLPYYNQDLVFGNTIDTLLNNLEDKIRKSGGIEKFLIDNIKYEKGGAVSPAKTPQTVLETLKERVDYLKKKVKKDEDTKVVEEVIKTFPPEIQKEVVKKVLNLKDSFRLKTDEDGEIKFGTPGYDSDFPEEIISSEKKAINEKEIDLNNIQDIYNLYNQLKSGYNNVAETIANAFNKFKGYTENKYNEYKSLNLKREQEQLEKLDKAEKDFNNVINYVKEKYENFPTDEIKINVGNRVEQFKDYAQAKFEETRDYLAEKRTALRENNRKEIEEKDRKYEEAIQDITKNFEQLKNYAEKQYQEFKTDFPSKFAATYNKLQTYLETVLEEVSKNLSPQTEEKILNNFANQNDYIEESLSMNIDSFIEEATDILTDELSKQDLYFDPEKIKAKLEETVKPFIIDEVITKNETIIEEAKNEIEKKQSEVNNILSKQKKKKPLEIEILTDNNDEFVTIGSSDYKGEFSDSVEEIEDIEKKSNETKSNLETITNILGEIDFITQEMIRKEAEKRKATPEEVKNEIIEAINNKPIEELKPIEKIYYNDTLVNEQAKKLEQELAEKTGEYLKLNGNKEADLIINVAQEVYENSFKTQALPYYRAIIERLEPKYKDVMYDISNLFKEKLQLISKEFKDNELFYDRDIDGKEIILNANSVPSLLFNKVMIASLEEYYLDSLEEEAIINDKEDELMLIDYLKPKLSDNRYNMANFLHKQNVKAYDQLNDISQKARILMEQELLDKEIKPALTSYINFASANTNDLKSSIKELGNAITGLSEGQLNKAIQNLPEEDRNKLINKVSGDLNALLDAVKEYAPEVMDSFNKLVEVQNLDKMIQNYQVSPETLQAVENKINEIAGEGKLTQQKVENKLTETTKGKGLQEIVQTVNKIITDFHPAKEESMRNVYGLPSTDAWVATAQSLGLPYTYTLSTSVGQATLDLFELDNLLRILYPIFKNLKLDIGDYIIKNPKELRRGGDTAIYDGQKIKFHKLATKYYDYVIPKFEELRNAIKDLPNFPDWLAKSTFEPNLEKAVQIAKEHGVTDSSIDEFMAKYREYQNAMNLIRQRMEELFKLHAAFTVAEDEKEDDSILGSVLGGVLGAVAAFVMPAAAGILTPSILAGTAAGTATSVSLGALGGATLGGTLQSMLGNKQYGNSGEVRNDIDELDRTMQEYYQKSNEAQTRIREKIMELGTKKE